MTFTNDIQNENNTDFLLEAFNFQDSQKIADILNDLWGFGKNLPHQKIADGFGKTYLFYSLFESTYAFTLKYKNVPVAFICWKENKSLDNKKNKTATKKNQQGKIKFLQKPLLLLKSIRYAVPILFCKEFYYQIKAWKAFFNGTESLNKELLHPYDAELILFVSSKDFRGKGLGRKLFNFFTQTLEEHKLHSFFLHTDTECSYQFYDKIGLSKLATKTMTEKNGSMQETWQIFIYGTD